MTKVDSAALAQKWREIRVLIYPSESDEQCTVAIVARRTTGTVNRDNLLWRGQLETPSGMMNVSQVLGAVSAALLAVSDDLSDT